MNSPWDKVVWIDKNLMLQSTSALLACASLSFVTCILIVSTIYFDPSSGTSRHISLVNRLLWSNIGLSISLIIYSIASDQLDLHSLQIFCNGFLPFPMYFFLTSYGWTILIAFKFRSNKSWFLPVEEQFQVPYWLVWLVALVLLLPTIFYNIIDPKHIDVVLDSNGTNMCVYNHSNTAGQAIDLATIQVPLISTILINLYSYSLGLFALRDSPHSVLARQMRKAGGYLFVLIVVWVPNVFYNFVSIINNANSDDPLFLEAGFCLAALQGFLNVIVYVVSNPGMFSWVISVLSCQRPWLRSSVRLSHDSSKVSIVTPSSSLSNFNGLNIHGIGPNGSFGSSSTGKSSSTISLGVTDESILSPISNNNNNSHNSHNSHHNSTGAGENHFGTFREPSLPTVDEELGEFSHSESDDGYSSGTNTTNTNTTANASYLMRDSFSIEPNKQEEEEAKSSKSGGKHGGKSGKEKKKGILQKKKGKKEFVLSNFDKEKFVRFGETTTRFLSESEGRPPSELGRDSLDNA